MGKYTITETIEVGHDRFIGGSVTISIKLRYIPQQTEKNNILSIIDCLDHSTITTNENTAKYSTRFFLLDKSVSIFDDIQTILYYFLGDRVCTVTLGKESYTNKLYQTSELLKYSCEG